MEDILDRLGLAEYTPRLVDEGFDNWDTLLDITESDLTQLQFKLGHRRKLQRAIAESRASSAAAAPPSLISLGKDSSGSQGLESREYASGSKPGDQNPTHRPKRRYKRHPRPDKNAPSRPLSAYVLFSNHIRDKSKREGHELNFSDMAKVVGEQWQMIPVQEREMYEQSAAAQKAEYITRLEEYKKTEQFREYEKYYANFKALHARDGSRDRPSDDEGAMTKKTKLLQELSNESKFSRTSNDSRPSLELSKYSSTGESPRSIGSDSDIADDIDHQRPYSTSPPERISYAAFPPPSPSAASSSTTTNHVSSSGRRHSSRFQQPHTYPAASEISPGSQTYGGLPRYGPISTSAGASAGKASSGSPYPGSHKQSPPSATFERTAASPPSSAANMSYRTLPPPIVSPAATSQPSRHHTSTQRSPPSDAMQTLLAAAESQAPGLSSTTKS